MSTALVIGGAGFIGANVAARHLARGEQVTVFDNLSRRGATENALWLEQQGAGNLRVVPGDAAREPRKLEREIERADRIYHLAGQVAVTTSIERPLEDHEANLTATLNVLEAMRSSSSEASLLFSSTNKVYGALDEVDVVLVDDRWGYADGREGVDETAALDFHSPYGCSKGGADQYVRDYARTFGLNSVVFRQSCIYGPRQFGVSDQGWIVHFILACALDQPLTIYGDGCQVRDALFVDDLVDAFELVAGDIGRHRGEHYNIGGGRANSLSIRELLVFLGQAFERTIRPSYGPWRKGDQRVFIADNGKLSRATGWRPRVGLRDGLRRTLEFVRANVDLFRTALG